MITLTYDHIGKYALYNLDYTLMEAYSKLNLKENNHDYSKDYFTVTALEDGSFTFGYPAGFSTLTGTSLSYSTDEGETWTTLTNADNIEVIVDGMPISEGDKILFKGINSKTNEGAVDADYGLMFISTGTVEVSGNIMSLIDEDNFRTISELSTEGIFSELFRKSSKVYPYGLGEQLVSAENLVLPATRLAPSCYTYMFLDCTSLTAAPGLPATTLSENCYESMFGGCTSLTTAPELPATNLAESCYSNMFGGCTSLTTAPELPSTNLAFNCYSGMFNNCKSLTTAPELPATNLAESCYSNMFSNCSLLNYIKALFTTTPSNTYTLSWVTNVAAQGTFVKNSAATWTTTGASGVPTGWTVQTASE